MSFQETKKTEKYKLPLQTAFTFHAFHPKAVNTCLLLAGLLASGWLGWLVQANPCISCLPGLPAQWRG